MSQLMRCLYCGLLQDEPVGVKSCARCGGELVFEAGSRPVGQGSYIQVQMELDQVTAPAGQNCDRYLLLTVRTPKQVPPEQAAPTLTGRPPLSFCAILDVSGSMHGEKIVQAKEAVRQSLLHLQDGDFFSMVTFSNEVRCGFEPGAVNERTRRTVDSALKEIEAGGMTALCGGLELGLDKVTAKSQETNLALLLSDGQANVGETDIEKVGQRGHQARQHGVIVSTLGVGDDYNEALMAEIATQGGGRFYHLQTASQISAYLTGELGEAAALAARDVMLNLTLPPGATLITLSAAYPTQQGGGQATVSLGNIPSDTELEIPLRLTLPAQQPSTRLSIEGALTYYSPAGNHLSAALNRVTMRFVDQATFHLRDGVVSPVAEKVLGQMKASHILGISRAYAKSPEEGEKQTEVELAALRDYAAKLGEERAEYEVQGAAEELSAIRASPRMAKVRMAAAFSVQRGTKDFNQK